MLCDFLHVHFPKRIHDVSVAVANLHFKHANIATTAT